MGETVVVVAFRHTVVIIIKFGKTGGEVVVVVFGRCRHRCCWNPCPVGDGGDGGPGDVASRWVARGCGGSGRLSVVVCSLK